MADRIKGITIEFRGNATPLQKAIREVDSALSKTTKELSSVNKALKFNPTSVELWRQKQDLLTKKVNETKTKLDALKQAQKQMDASGVDKNSEEYRKLQRQIIETGSKLKTFRSQLREVGNANLKALSEKFKAAGTSIESAGQSLRGVSMAAAGVVAGLGAISVKAGAAADDLNTLSKVTGIGTGDLQKYGYAADLVDVSVETIAKSVKKLGRNAYEAADGTGTQAEAFAKLGVAVTDSNGEMRDSEAIFQDTLKALGQMTNETERDAIAQQLMGKSAAELNPLIEDGGETYKMVADTMAKYKLDYVDQETLDKATEFNDSLDTMKLLGSVAFAQVGSQLAGYLAPALEKVVDLVGRFASWLSKLDPGLLTVIAGIAAVVAVLAPLLIGIGKVAFAISSIMSVMSALSGAMTALSLGPIAGIVAAIAAVIAIGVLLYKNWDKIKATAAALGAKLKEVWEGIKRSISDAVNAIRTKLVGAWINIKTTVSNLVNSLKNGIVGAWTNIKTTVSNLVNNLKNGIVGAWNNIKTTVSGLVNGLRDGIVGAWNKVKETISNAAEKIWDKLTSPFTKAWDKIKEIIDKIKGLFPIDLSGFFGDIELPHFSWEWEDIGGVISIPKISVDWYDKGGIFNSPSVIGVGEKRPEFVGALDDLRKIVREESGAGSSAPVINIYPQAHQSASDIAREVEKVLVQWQNQRKAAYGNI